MSGFLAGKVWQSNLPRKIKPLAAALADIANDDGTSIYPSIAYVAWLLSSSKRFVQNGMAKLRASGVLEVVANPGGGRSLTVEYRMIESRLPARPAWRRRGKGENCASFPASPAAEKDAGPNTKGSTPRPKGCKSRHERAHTSAHDPSVSGSNPSVSAPQEAGQQSNHPLTKLSSSKAFPFPKRPADPLRSDLYGGINWKRIENVLFDARHCPFEEQLIAALRVATTDLSLNRTGKMMVVQASDVERLALERLFHGLETLRAVANFTQRTRVSRDAIGNAVISAAAELLKGKEVEVPA